MNHIYMSLSSFDSVPIFLDIQNLQACPSTILWFSDKLYIHPAKRMFYYLNL